MWLRDFRTPPGWTDYEPHANASLEHFAERVAAYIDSYEVPVVVVANPLEGVTLAMLQTMDRDEWPGAARAVFDVVRSLPDALRLALVNTDLLEAVTVAVDAEAVVKALQSMVETERDMKTHMETYQKWFATVVPRDVSRARAWATMYNDVEDAVAGVDEIMARLAGRTLVQMREAVLAGNERATPAAVSLLKSATVEQTARATNVRAFVREVLLSRVPDTEPTYPFDALAPTLMFRNHDEYVTYLVDGTRTKGLAYSNMNTRVKIDWPRAEASLLSPEELRALDDVLSTWGTAHRRGLAEARGAIGRFGVAYAVWKAKREVVAAQGRLKRYVDACAAHRVAAEKRHASRVYDERCEWRNRLARDLAAHFSRLSDAVLRPWRQLRMFKYALILNENGEFEVTDVRGPRPFIVAVNTLEGGVVDPESEKYVRWFALDRCGPERGTPRQRVAYGVDKLAWEIHDAFAAGHHDHTAPEDGTHLPSLAPDAVLVGRDVEAGEPHKHPGVLAQNVDGASPVRDYEARIALLPDTTPQREIVARVNMSDEVVVGGVSTPPHPEEIGADKRPRIAGFSDGASGVGGEPPTIYTVRINSKAEAVRTEGTSHMSVGIIGEGLAAEFIVLSTTSADLAEEACGVLAKALTQTQPKRLLKMLQNPDQTKTKETKLYRSLIELSDTYAGRA